MLRKCFGATALGGEKRFEVHKRSLVNTKPQVK